MDPLLPPSPRDEDNPGSVDSPDATMVDRAEHEPTCADMRTLLTNLNGDMESLSSQVEQLGTALQKLLDNGKMSVSKHNVFNSYNIKCITMYIY